MISTEEFYDKISSKYTEAIKKCVPRYEEMLLSLFRYVPEFRSNIRILELGCGTGNLTELIVSHYPDAEITVVDISSEIIELCKERLSGKKIQFQKDDFAKLSYAQGSFDLVMSSIAIHHLKDAEKKRLFANIFQWLVFGGVFSWSDQFRGKTSELYQKHIEVWKKHAFQSGTSEQEWETWLEHQRLHDYHAPLQEQMQWLQECRFSIVDCTWRYSLWATIYACKA
jgi:tRNA (cmo5U34)-methyltransferase